LYLANKERLKAQEFVSFIKEFGKNGDCPLKNVPRRDRGLSLFFISEQGESINGVEELDIYRKKFEKFYLASLKRDEAFLKNLKRYMKGTDRAILFSGGFHTENLKELLEEQGYSYVVVMPKMSGTGTSPYFTLLSGGKSDVEKIVEASISNIAVPSMLSDMGIAGTRDKNLFELSVDVVRALEEKGRITLLMPYGYVTLSREEVNEYSRVIGKINGEDVYATRTDEALTGEQPVEVIFDHDNLSYEGHEVMDTLWQIAHERSWELTARRLKDTEHWNRMRLNLVRWIGEENVKNIENDLLPDTWVVTKRGEALPWKVGHASWRGIHLTYTNNYIEMAGTLVHELGAYYGKTHKFNEILEDAVKAGRQDEVTDLLSRLDEKNRLKEEGQTLTEEGEARDFAKPDSINVTEVIKFHNTFQKLVDENKIGQETPEGYRIALREIIRVTDFIVEHVKTLKNPNLALAWALREIYFRRLHTEKDRNRIKQLIFSMDSLKGLDLEPLFGEVSDIEVLMDDYGPAGAYLMTHTKGDLPADIKSLIVRLAELTMSRDPVSNEAGILSLLGLPDELAYGTLDCLFNVFGHVTPASVYAYAQVVLRLDDADEKKRAFDSIMKGIYPLRDFEVVKASIKALRDIVLAIDDEERKRRLVDELSGLIDRLEGIGPPGMAARPQAIEILGDVCASLNDAARKIIIMDELSIRDFKYDTSISLPAIRSYTRIAESLDDDEKEKALTHLIELMNTESDIQITQGSYERIYAYVEVAALLEEQEKIDALNRLMENERQKRLKVADPTSEERKKLDKVGTGEMSLWEWMVTRETSEGAHTDQALMVAKMAGHLAPSLPEERKEELIDIVLKTLKVVKNELFSMAISDSCVAIILSSETADTRDRLLKKVTACINGEASWVTRWEIPNVLEIYGRAKIAAGDDNIDFDILKKYAVYEGEHQREDNAKTAIKVYGDIIIERNKEDEKIEALDYLRELYKPDSDRLSSIAGLTAGGIALIRDNDNLIRTVIRIAGRIAVTLKDNDEKKIAVINSLRERFQSIDFQLDAIDAAGQIAVTLRDNPFTREEIEKLVKEFDGLLPQLDNSAAITYAELVKSTLKRYRVALEELYDRNHKSFISTDGDPVALQKLSPYEIEVDREAGLIRGKVNDEVVVTQPIFGDIDEQFLKEQNMVLTGDTKRDLTDLMFFTSQKKLQPVFLLGPTGTGKTAKIRYLSTLVGKKFLRVQVNAQTDELDLLGHFMPKGLSVSFDEAKAIIHERLNSNQMTDIQHALSLILPNREAKRRAKKDPAFAREKVMEYMTERKEQDDFVRSLGHILRYGAVGVELEFKKAHFLRALENRFQIMYMPRMSTTQLKRILYDKYPIEGVSHTDIESLVELNDTLDGFMQTTKFKGFEYERPYPFTIRNVEHILQNTMLRLGTEDNTLSARDALIKEVFIEYRDILNRDPENISLLEEHIKVSFGKDIVIPGMDLTLYEDGNIIKLDGMLSPGPKDDDKDKSRLVRIEDVNLIQTESTRDLSRAVLYGFRNPARPVMLVGQTAGGKTDTIANTARILGWQYHSENLRDTPLSSLIGTWQRDPLTGILKFKDGILIEAMTKGYCLVLEEINFMDTGLLEVISEWIDEGHFTNPKTHERVDIHDDFRLFATLNPQQGTTRLSLGRNILPAPFINRFKLVWVNEKTPEEQKEIFRNTLDREGIDSSITDEFVDFHNKFQELVKDNKIGVETPEGYRISLREIGRVADFIIAHIKTLKSVRLTLAWAIREIYFKRLNSDEDRSLIRQLIYDMDAIKDMDTESVFDEVPDNIEDLAAMYGHAGAHLVYHTKGDLSPDIRMFILRIAELLNKSDEESVRAGIASLSELPAGLVLEVLDIIGLKTIEAVTVYADKVIELDDEDVKKRALDIIQVLFEGGLDDFRLVAVEAFSRVACSFETEAQRVAIVNDLKKKFPDGRVYVREAAVQAAVEIASTISDNRLKNNLLNRLISYFEHDDNGIVIRAVGKIMEGIEDEDKKYEVMGVLKPYLAYHEEVAIPAIQVFAEISKDLANDNQKIDSMDDLIEQAKHYKDDMKKAVAEGVNTIISGIKSARARKKIEQKFLEMLDTLNWNMQALAIRVCGNIAENVSDKKWITDVLDKLVMSYDHISHEVTAESAKALSKILTRINDDGLKLIILSKLSELFADKFMNVKQAASLAYIEISRSVKTKTRMKQMLVVSRELFSHEENVARVAAAQAYANAVTGLLNKSEGRKALDALTALFTDKDWKVRHSAVMAYGRIANNISVKGDKADMLDNLMVCLKDRQWRVKWSVIMSCASLVDEINDESKQAEYFERLKKLIRQKDWKIKKVVAIALGIIGPGFQDDKKKIEVLNEIAGLFSHEESSVRKEAITAFLDVCVSVRDSSGMSEALNKLTDLFEDEFPHIRELAVRAYGQGVSELLKGYKDPIKELYQKNRVRFTEAAEVDDTAGTFELEVEQHGDEDSQADVPTGMDLAAIFGEEDDAIEEDAKRYGLAGAYFMYHMRGAEHTPLKSLIMHMRRLMKKGDAEPLKTVMNHLPNIPPELLVDVCKMFDAEPSDIIDVFDRISERLEEELLKRDVLDQLEAIYNGVAGEEENKVNMIRRKICPIYSRIALTLSDEQERIKRSIKLKQYYIETNDFDTKTEISKGYLQLILSTANKIDSLEEIIANVEMEYILKEAAIAYSSIVMLLEDKEAKIQGMKKLEGLFVHTSWVVVCNAVAGYASVAATLEEEEDGDPKIEALDKLSGLFGHKEKQVEMDAAKGISEIAQSLKRMDKKKDALNELLKLFKHKWYDVCEAAAECYGQVVRSFSEEKDRIDMAGQLLTLIDDDTSGTTKRAIIRAYGGIAVSIEDKDQRLEMADTIAGLFKDTDWAVQRQVVQSYIQVVKSFDGKLTDLSMKSVLAVLYRMMDPGVYHQVRYEAVTGYYEIMAALEDADSLKIEGLERIKRLLERTTIIEDKDSVTRSRLGEGYGKIALSLDNKEEARDAADKLVGLFNSDSVEIRHKAIENYTDIAISLGDESRIKKASEYMVTIAQDKSWLVQRAAAIVYRSIAVYSDSDDEKMKGLEKIKNLFSDDENIQRHVIENVGLAALSLKQTANKEKALIFLTTFLDKTKFRFRETLVDMCIKIVESIEVLEDRVNTLEAWIPLMHHESTNISDLAAGAYGTIISSVLALHEDVIRDLYEKNHARFESVSRVKGDGHEEPAYDLVVTKGPETIGHEPSQISAADLFDDDLEGIEGLESLYGYAGAYLVYHTQGELHPDARAIMRKIVGLLTNVDDKTLGKIKEYFIDIPIDLLFPVLAICFKDMYRVDYLEKGEQAEDKLLLNLIENRGYDELGSAIAQMLGQKLAESGDVSKMEKILDAILPITDNMYTYTESYEDYMYQIPAPTSPYTEALVTILGYIGLALKDNAPVQDRIIEQLETIANHKDEINYVEMPSGGTTVAGSTCVYSATRQAVKSYLEKLRDETSDMKTIESELSGHRQSIQSLYEHNHLRFNETSVFKEAPDLPHEISIDKKYGMIRGMVNGHVVVEQPILGEVDEEYVQSQKLILTPEAKRTLIDLMFFTAQKKLAPVFLIGPTGTGKTSKIRYLSSMVGKRFLRVQVNAQTDEIDLLGHFMPKGMSISYEEASAVINERLQNDFISEIQYALSVLLPTEEEKEQARTNPEYTRQKVLLAMTLKGEKQEDFVRSVGHILRYGAVGVDLEFKKAHFLEGLERGDWILLDEINLAREESLGILYGLLTKGYLEFGGKKIYPKAKNGMLFAAGNTTMDVGRQLFSEALENRFQIIYTPRMSLSQLKQILFEKYPIEGVSAADIESLVELNDTMDTFMQTNKFKGFEYERPYPFTIRNIEHILQNTKIRLAQKTNMLSAKEALIHEVYLEYKDIVDRDQENITLLEKHIRVSFGDDIYIPGPDLTLEEGADAAMIDGILTYGPIDKDNRDKERILTKADVDLIPTKSTRDLSRVVLYGFRNQRRPLMLIGQTAGGKTDTVANTARILGWQYHS